MSDRPPHLYEYLTKPEWQTCFALAFVEMTEEYGDAVDLSRYHVEGKEDTWESAIIAAVRYLALEHGFDFEAVMVREEDQEILPVQPEPICPQNMLYAQLLHLRKLPHVANALAVAIRTLHDKAPQFNTEALADALEDVEEAMRRVTASTDPEQLKQTESTMDEALASLGVKRIRQVHLN